MALTVLDALDAAVHRADESKLHVALQTVVKRSSIPYNPAVHNVCNSVLAVSKGTKESILERIQRCKGSYRSAQLHAIETARLRLKSRTQVGTIIAPEIVQMLPKGVTVHVLGHHTLSLPSVQYDPLAARQLIKHVDVVILPVTVITSQGIVGQMGVELLAELAHSRGIPVYAFATGFQYDKHPSIALLKGHEDNLLKARGKSTHHFTASFESIAPEKITGIISELGILSHERFIAEVSHHYPWLF